MLKRFVRWFFGYLYITLRGDYPEHFVNLCTNKDIKIWGMSCNCGACSCYISLKDFRETRGIAKRTHTRPIIKRRYGRPFLVRRILKRKVYFISILLFCALLFTLSRYIWDVSIEGGYTHTPEQLITYLETTGVYSGCKISEIDCPQIEENIRRDFNDIGWVSAQIKGTRLIVSIVETKMPVLEAENKTDLPYADIVAKKDGIIYRMITRSGTPKVELGSVVKKGDVLISGVIPIYGDDQLVKETKLVVADGDVSIKSFYEYSNEFSLQYEERIYTGASKKGFVLELFTKKIFDISPSNSYEHYDIINDMNTLKLVRNFYLPIRYIKTEVQEYKLVPAVYTEAQALGKANSELMKYMEQLKKNQITIVENQVVTSVIDGICTSTGKIIVEEPAWEYKKIDDSEWRIEETDEHSGNDH